MGNLTETIPKPMLKYKGKNLIEYKIDALPDEIDEVILVVGYLEGSIRDFFGDKYKGRKITYVHMENLTGTGSALWLCKDLLKEKFLVMMGDDIYSAEDMEKMIKEDWAILVKKIEYSISGGNIKTDENGNFIDINEITEKQTVLINTGMYVLQPEIFNYNLVKLEGKDEYGLPQTMLSATKDYEIKVLYTDDWKQITKPEDLE